MAAAVFDLKNFSGNKIRLVIAGIIGILSILAIYGIFYPLDFLSLQFVPLR